MTRRFHLHVLAAILVLATALSGCATPLPSGLRELQQKEGFNLHGRSKRPLRSILNVFRELEADDRPL